MQETIPTTFITGKCKSPALTELLRFRDFEVTGYEIDPIWDRVIVFCEVRSPVARCPDCQNLSEAVHQHHPRVVRDMAMWGMQCYLEFTIRRFECNHCDDVFTERLDSIRFNSLYTRRYEAYVFDQVRATDIRTVYRQEGLGEKAVTGIFEREVERRLFEETRPPVRVLGVDEISLKKHHGQYVLILSDLERGCVIDVLPDRLKATLQAWFDDLSPDEREAIEVVSMDMHVPFFDAVKMKLPSAMVVADRFHVMKNLLVCVTKARREIQRNADDQTKERLKGIRWLLLTNNEKLDDEQQQKLAQALEASSELRTLYELKEEFRELFESNDTRADANQALQAWRERARATNLSSLQSFLTTLNNWSAQILNYFHDRVTQGFVEGMNNKIKLIKRRCFGFRNFENFRLRILATCGLPH